MITKAVVQSVNAAGNRCIVRMPLFETASSSNKVEAEALVNIAPGLFNGLTAGDIVFVAFEENALEKPIILGKLFRGSDIEGSIRGGGGVLDTLKVQTAASIPASTLYAYAPDIKNNYKDLNTPKKQADYIKWLEKLVKTLAAQLENNVKCLKNWTQWQLRPENVEIDDGDLDNEYDIAESYLYQEEGKDCKICGDNCPKNNKRNYLKLPINKNYPDM